jgi:thiol-disulfide isomerase/thioredoxin
LTVGRRPAKKRFPRFPSLAAAMAGILLLLAGPGTGAGGRVLITPIDVKALEAMINATPGPLLAVAMASWCAPCLKEIPSLNRLSAKYGPNGLRIIGLSVDMEGPAAMQAAADNLKVAFPVYWIGEPGMEAMKIAAIPMIIVVKNGKELERIVGARSEADLEKKIRHILARPNGG